MKLSLSLLLAVMVLPTYTAAQTAGHVTVYSEPGRFGGWPANHGIWSWANEIVVGFSAAYFLWNDEDRHPYDRSKPDG